MIQHRDLRLLVTFPIYSEEIDVRRTNLVRAAERINVVRCKELAVEKKPIPICYSRRIVLGEYVHGVEIVLENLSWIKRHTRNIVLSGFLVSWYESFVKSFYM